MGATKAKKLREKRIREGKYDPTNQRGSWNGILPIERTTPTRQEAQLKLHKKHKQKWNQSHAGDDSIFLLPRLLYLKMSCPMSANLYFPMFSIGATRP
ncbi:hypothetical protein BVG16_07445 [Paenibacillus selenitireducens]|uniref:Uncharacterized protein n=1 Tax=Paenibacillus selenitireducens TaxID=1324314 RepID=A0A1T2XL00_9BACL|nr:hypothetical protein [Paenibacillus selenitireducens]OPA80551.1 hypothetical protein BVG16_07445 [Paenibacillus selenitireducens]